jgi:hypothetical protein
MFHVERSGFEIAAWPGPYALKSCQIGRMEAAIEGSPGRILPASPQKEQKKHDCGEDQPGRQPEMDLQKIEQARPEPRQLGASGNRKPFPCLREEALWIEEEKKNYRPAGAHCQSSCCMPRPGTALVAGSLFYLAIESVTYSHSIGNLRPKVL